MHSIDTIRNIHFEPSSLCNARCPVCPRYSNGGLKNKLLKEQAVSYESYKKWFPHSILNQVGRMLFCGNHGDPATNPDLLDIIEYTIGHNTDGIIINTNGGLRDEKFWTELGKMSRMANERVPESLVVVFAIDGLEDTNHLYRRGVNWEKLYNNFTSYINAGGNAYWAWLEFSHNEHQLKNARRLSKFWGFTRFYTNKPFGFADLSPMTYGETRTPSMMVLDKDGNYEYELYPSGITREQYNRPMVEFKGEINYNATPITEPSPQDIKDRNNELSCQSIELNEIYISADGQVHPCCYLSGFKNAPYMSYMKHQYIELVDPYFDNLNLKTNSLEDILNNDFFQKKMIDGMKPGENRLAGCSSFCSKR